MNEQPSNSRPSSQVLAARAALKREDWTTAIHLYEPLARLGSTEAMMGLALIYDSGSWTSARSFQDFQAARYWYDKAYVQGNLVQAALGLGNIYYLGRGVPVNYDKAFNYFKLFEETNEPVGLRRLAVMYQLGESVKRDAGKACQLYSKAAKLGNIIARKNLGVLLWQEWRNPKGLLLWGWAICQGIWFFAFKKTSPRVRA
jgi:TPR repeat protein